MADEIHVQYVRPSGDDANTGDSWESAKRTLLAAYDALSGPGGTIYFESGTSVGDDPEAGLWLYEPWEEGGVPITPPPGFRLDKNLRVIGVSNPFHVSGQPGIPTAVLKGGSMVDPLKPLFWSANTSATISFENVFFGQTGCWTPIRLGCKPPANALPPMPTPPDPSVAGDVDRYHHDLEQRWLDHVRRDSETWNVSFHACSIASVAAPGLGGPAIDAGGAFYVWFTRCGINGPNGSPWPPEDGPAGDVARDRATAALFKSTAAKSAWSVHFHHCNTNEGPIRYYQGEGGGLEVRHFNMEWNRLVSPGDPREHAPPAVSVLPGPNMNARSIVTAATHRFENVSCFAELDTQPVDVAIDLPQISPELVICTGIARVRGPATVMGLVTQAQRAETRTPAANGQVGLWAGRVVAQHDSARRAFGPAVVRFPNLVSHDLGAWSASPTMTVSPGIVAPNGTREAARLTTTLPALPDAITRDVVVPAQLGDFVVFGVWVRAASAADGFGTYLIRLQGVNPGLSFEGIGAQAQVLNHVHGDGEWAWAAMAAKIEAPSSPSSASEPLRLSLFSYLPGSGIVGGPMEYFAPMLLHLPASEVSENEAHEIAQHLAAYPAGVPAGVAATLGRQDLALVGRLISGGDHPTIELQAAAGTGAHGGISGNELAGEIVLTTGTGTVSAGPLATIELAMRAGASGPGNVPDKLRVVLSPGNGAASVNAPAFYTTPGPGGSGSFDLHAANAPAEGTEYRFHFHLFL